MPKVQRFFLEIKKTLKKEDKFKFPSNVEIYTDISKDINLNKFFYRQIGLDHFWRDRLVWSDNEWIKYVNNKNLETGILKFNEDLAGFYELKFHPNKKESELIQMGILKEHQGKKLGSLLLNYVISKAFSNNLTKRLWVHTCSLDHKYALKNYLSRGLKVFKKEEIEFEY